MIDTPFIPRKFKEKDTRLSIKKLEWEIEQLQMDSSKHQKDMEECENIIRDKIIHQHSVPEVRQRLMEDWLSAKTNEEEKSNMIWEKKRNHIINLPKKQLTTDQDEGWSTVYHRKKYNKQNYNQHQNRPQNKQFDSFPRNNKDTRNPYGHRNQNHQTDSKPRNYNPTHNNSKYESYANAVTGNNDKYNTHSHREENVDWKNRDDDWDYDSDNEWDYDSDNDNDWHNDWYNGNRRNINNNYRNNYNQRFGNKQSHNNRFLGRSHRNGYHYN